MENEEEKVESEATGTEEHVEAEATGTTEEEIDWKAKAEKAEELAKNYKIRAEKAEGKIKEVPKPVVNSGDLSSKDVIYLAKVDIHEDDMEEVLNYSKKMGVGIKEAHDFFKPILMIRSEQRKTAEVTNTGTGRRGAQAPSGEDLLSKATEGNIPESDADIAKVVKAKLESMKK